jgi:hypothetical protein
VLYSNKNFIKNPANVGQMVLLLYLLNNSVVQSWANGFRNHKMNFMTEFCFKTFLKSLPRVRKEVKNCNRQRTPCRIALRATPASGLISFSLAKFGRLNCLQGFEIAGNVDLTLKNIIFWLRQLGDFSTEIK